MSKPRVLILGGSGFIGRNLVVYLVENDLAEKVRVADKVIPKTAYLTARQQAAFDKVEFVQANLAREPMVKKAFEDPSGPFTFVFNCAGMAKYGQDQVVYEEGVYALSMTCAKEAAARGVERFIELSTTQIYAADKKPSAEDSKIKPWTNLADFKLRVEQELPSIAGLKFNIVRPAITYGVSDMLGLMPRLIVGAVYKKLKETMKTLWTKELRLNTVHVDDVVRALWHVALKATPGQTFNLADKGDTSQETVNKLVGQLFGIEVGYAGTIQSNLAKAFMSSATEEINEKHMGPWSEMCREAGIENTPLSPYLDQELLYNNSTSVDGAAIEATGFAYTQPALTVEALREMVANYVELGIFPKGYLA